MAPHSRSIVIIAGATGVGKTAALTELASESRSIPPFEVVSADSRQIYRSMNIGTAKPSILEQAAVPHHLIDICEPGEQYSVGQFVADADRAIEEIRSRGSVPVIAGGTGFYLLGYLHGLPDTPPADIAMRKDLAVRLERDGLEPLRQELRSVDPESEARISPNDSYRVLRALEVWYSSGIPLSHIRIPQETRPGIRAELFVLTRPRAALHARINARAAAMMAQGLRAEYEQLRASGWGPDDPGLRSIGYREFSECSDCPDDRIVAAIATNTRRYAKRQETFFRRLPDATWLDVEGADTQTTLKTALGRAVLDNTP